MKMGSKNCWHIDILLVSSWPYFGMCLKLDCNPSDAWNDCCIQCMPPFTWLHYNTSTCCHQILNKWYDLAVHSNVSYLSKHVSISQVGGHYFLTTDDANLLNNGTIFALSAVIWYVVSSALEAELAALFYSVQNAVLLWQTLKEMGNHQPRTFISKDNSTTHGLITDTIIPKASKATDMWLNWLKCCQAWQQFRIQWQSGSAILDITTPNTIQLSITKKCKKCTLQTSLLHMTNFLYLQGCVEITWPGNLPSMYN